MSNILIEANNITKVYDPDIFLKRGKNIYALDNVNFVLDEGDFICIMGPSGSGKSTLLNCLSTLDKISSGSIRIMNKDISTLNKNELCQFRYEYLGLYFRIIISFPIFQFLTILHHLQCWLKKIQKHFKIELLKLLET